MQRDDTQDKLAQATAAAEQATADCLRLVAAMGLPTNATIAKCLARVKQLCDAEADVASLRDTATRALERRADARTALAEAEHRLEVIRRDLAEVERERDEAMTSGMDAWTRQTEISEHYKARAERLERERDECIRIAAEAIGTEESLRSVGCVEALAGWCKELQEGADRLVLNRDEWAARAEKAAAELAEVKRERDEALSERVATHARCVALKRERDEARENGLDTLELVERVGKERDKEREAHEYCGNEWRRASITAGIERGCAKRMADALRVVRDLAGSNTVCANYPPSPGSYGDIYNRADAALADAPKPLTGAEMDAADRVSECRHGTEGAAADPSTCSACAWDDTPEPSSPEPLCADDEADAMSTPTDHDPGDEEPEKRECVVPRTPSWAEVLAGAQRAKERVAKWPAWKRELSPSTWDKPPHPKPADAPPQREPTAAEADALTRAHRASVRRVATAPCPECERLRDAETEAACRATNWRAKYDHEVRKIASLVGAADDRAVRAEVQTERLQQWANTLRDDIIIVEIVPVQLWGDNHWRCNRCNAEWRGAKDANEHKSDCILAKPRAALTPDRPAAHQCGKCHGPDCEGCRVLVAGKARPQSERGHDYRPDRPAEKRGPAPDGE